MNHMPSLAVGLIGAGRIGSNHAEVIARRIPNAQLRAIADPVDGAAERLARELNVPHAYSDSAELLANPEIQAVVITAPARFHTDLVEQATAAGKAVFCEKPAAMTLEDSQRVIEAAEKHGVVFRIGFNRRFANGFGEAHQAVVDGHVGTPQLLRSVTRDPGLPDPAAVPQWTIFMETLIHDFDTLNYLNPEAHAVQVFATADALVAPDFKESGLLDTAIVNIRYSNGAMATAEASFSASYGYDTRAEVFGSKGMATAGDLAASSMRLYGPGGIGIDTVRRDTEALGHSYIAELQSFTDASLANNTDTSPGAYDGYKALQIALAAIESYRTNAPVEL